MDCIILIIITILSSITTFFRRCICPRLVPNITITKPTSTLFYTHNFFILCILFHSTHSTHSSRSAPSLLSSSTFLSHSSHFSSYFSQNIGGQQGAYQQPMWNPNAMPSFPSPSPTAYVPPAVADPLTTYASQVEKHALYCILYTVYCIPYPVYCVIVHCVLQ